MNEPHCILCPLDFSEATPFGLNVAETLARRFGASLVLLHVVQLLPVPLRLPVEPGGAYDRWDDEARQRLDEVAHEVRKRGVAVVTEIGRGAPVQQIEAMVADRDIDLIVLPTHGRAGLDRLLHGSVAEGVVRAGVAPVITVPPELESLEPFDPRRLLIATDFSEHAELAFDAALGLAQRFAAELVIAHVFTFEHIGEHGAEWMLPTFTKEQVEEAIAEVTRRLEQLAERAGKHGIAVSTDVSQGSSPAREIARLAEEEDVDLVVVAGQGEGMLKHALLGSTTTKLVRACSRPLLTVPTRPPEPAGEGLEAMVPAGC